MSAPELADTAIEFIETEDPSAMVLNFANPDMVGHTGDFDAAVTAVEAVDEQLGRLVESSPDCWRSRTHLADHGNADDMGTEDDHTRPTRPTPSRSSTSLPTELPAVGLPVTAGRWPTSRRRCSR